MSMTIHEIARLCEVSPTAVSFVLNHKADGKVSKEKQERIRTVIERHGYKRSAAAQALPQRRTLRIGLCAVPAEQPIFGNLSHHTLVNEAATRLYEMGYGIAMIGIDPGESPARNARLLAAESVDGYLLVNLPANLAERLVFSLEQNGRPVISLGTPIREYDHWVSIDRGGSFAAGLTHLLQQGMQRIVMLDNDFPKTYSAEKIAAYEETMRREDATAFPVACPEANTSRATHSAIRKILSAYPDIDAIALTDNGTADVAQLALGDREIQLIGFGDAAFAEMCDPPIPYMAFPIREMADAATLHLLALLQSPPEPEPLRLNMLCNLADTCRKERQD